MSDGQAPPNPLKALRARLDETDESIVRLLAQRLETVGEIVKAKSGRADGIRDPAREREVLARVESIAQGLGMSGPLARKVFQELIEHSVAKQAATLSGVTGQEVTIALQGWPQTYDHFAAEKYVAHAGTHARFVDAGSLAGAVKLLLAKEVDLAFLPIENTFAGSINQVYEILRGENVHIVGEETMKIDHCLAALADVPLSAIDRVLSHPMVLDQCSVFLEALPQARAVATRDTAEALRLVAEGKDPTQVAIGAPEAVSGFGLHVLRRSIGNQPEILSRFVALANAPAHVDPRVPCKTSLILSTRHEHGALVTCLQILSDHGLSLTKLESRPRPGSPWEYMFFVDFEGHAEKPEVAAALDALRARALHLKVLGCYPAKATPGDAQVAQIKGAAPVVAPPVGKPVIGAPEPAVRRPRAFKLTERSARAEDTVVRVGSLLIGGTGFTVVAGPPAVESASQIDEAARVLREAGAHVLAGGVFIPRTSPYAFQGLGWDGLDALVAAGKKWGLPVVTEVIAPDEVRTAADKVDLLRVGARNMQNFALLRELGRTARPIILDRGVSATVDEWLAAAEHILAQGNAQVILCERGIRTFEPSTRHTLDLSVIPLLRERTHLPIVVDPGNATGRPLAVAPMAWAARAAGAHGVLVDVHTHPPDALAGGAQCLSPAQFGALMAGLARAGAPA